MEEKREIMKKICLKIVKVVFKISVCKDIIVVRLEAEKVTLFSGFGSSFFVLIRVRVIGVVGIWVVCLILVFGVGGWGCGVGKLCRASEEILVCRGLGLVTVGIFSLF